MSGLELPTSLAFTSKVITENVAHLAHAAKTWGLFDGLRTKKIQTSSTRPLTAANFEFPAELPQAYGDGLIMVDDWVPALPLTQKLYHNLSSMVQILHRHQRIEKILSVDRSAAYRELDTLRGHISAVIKRRNLTRGVLEAQEKDKSQGVVTEPQYGQEELDELNDLIRTGLNNTRKRQDGIKDIDTEIMHERKHALLQLFETGNLLLDSFAESGLQPPEKQQTLAERRSYGVHTRHMYRSRNIKNFQFADELVRKEGVVKRSQVSDDSDSSLSDSLVSAINDFDICHFNRLIAIEDFARMGELAADRQRDRIASMPLPDFLSFQDQDLEGFAEKRRLTQNLAKAQSDYRIAVRRLRRHGKSVATDDSTHLSSITTQPPSVTEQYVNMIRMRHRMKVRNWREKVPMSPSSSHGTLNNVQSEYNTIRMGSGFSQLNGRMTDATDYQAIKQRAWRRERRKRDRDYLKRRRRAGSAVGSESSSTALRRASERGRPEARTRNHLSGRWRGHWPVGGYSPVRDRKTFLRTARSFSSSVGNDIE